MRILCGVWFAVALCAGQNGKTKTDVPQGIKTPGVQIPFASLKADAELTLAPRWIVFSDSVLLPNKAGGLERLDAKTNKLVDPVAGTAESMRRRGHWIYQPLDSGLRHAFAGAPRRESRGRSEGSAARAREQGQDGREGSREERAS